MQRIIVILIIAGTILYVGLKAYRKLFHKEKGCDKCGLNDSHRA